MLNTANYYDNGGVSGNFTAANYVQTLVPDNPLNKLKIYIDSWNVSCGSNQLLIYDGPSTSSPLVADLRAAGSNFSYQSTHSSGALTIRMQINNGGCIDRGWNAYITSVGTTTKDIKWNIVGTSKRFDIDYSVNGGTAWTRVVSDLPNTTGVYGWQVPNTPSTQARVRVRDAGNNKIVDSSDANFTIGAASPVFVLTAPNGGEVLYPNTTAVIKWYSAFVSNNVSLEYSIDNGTNWVPIIGSYANNTGGALPTEGTYSWLVPNTPSVQCLVRVKDAANASASDVSNAVFTIRPHITVLTPNGGESGTRCSAYNITWAAGGTSGVYKLEYSVDGGSNWLLIANNVSTGCTGNNCVYSWTLPNVLTSQLKVRVSDVADATKVDVSDGNMSVTVPPNPVTLLSPNGGETWVAGTTQNITYQYGSGTTQVSLEYSEDNGQSWVAIASNITANGSYAWVVPNTPSTSTLVKVTGNQFNGCDYDVSNAVFTIASSVLVTQPNGGEVWQATVGDQGKTINMSNATVVLNTANYYDNGGVL